MPRTMLRNSSFCRPITLSGKSHGNSSSDSAIASIRWSRREASPIRIEPLVHFLPPRAGDSRAYRATIDARNRENIACRRRDPHLVGLSELLDEERPHLRRHFPCASSSTASRVVPARILLLFGGVDNVPSLTMNTL